MSLRTHAFTAVTLCSMVFSVAACDQSGTRDATVTTSSPAGESTAPSAAVAERSDKALVRVVHASPGGMAVDVLADGVIVFEGVDYKGVTPYQAMEGKRYEFGVRGAGSAGEPMASNREGLDDGDYYTVFVLPGDGDRAALLRVVNDDLALIDDGKARIRVVHAGTGMEEIDVHMAGIEDALVGGVDFQSVTHYYEVDPADGALQVSIDGQNALVATVADARVQAGRFYTMVVVGHSRSAAGVEAFLVEDILIPTTSTTPGR